MFSLEASWSELPSDERLRKCKERLAPLMMAFFDWCGNQSVLPGSKLGSAIILSLLETAKRNGLDSEKYLTYLLEKLPNEASFEKKAVLAAYLPWSEIVQANCK